MFSTAKKPRITGANDEYRPVNLLRDSHRSHSHKIPVSGHAHNAALPCFTPFTVATSPFRVTVASVDLTNAH